MVYEITEGVEVSAEVFFQEDISNPYNSEYIFAYRITIRNTNVHAVKLLKRKWIITEGNGNHKIIEGDGVIGEQPVIYQNESYQYISASNIKTDIGKMKGSYTMIYPDTMQEFTVQIPEFILIAPFKLN